MCILLIYFLTLAHVNQVKEVWIFQTSWKEDGYAKFFFYELET